MCLPCRPGASPRAVEDGELRPSSPSSRRPRSAHSGWTRSRGVTGVSTWHLVGLSDCLMVAGRAQPRDVETRMESTAPGPSAQALPELHCGLLHPGQPLAGGGGGAAVGGSGVAGAVGREARVRLGAVRQLGAVGLVARVRVRVGAAGPRGGRTCAREGVSAGARVCGTRDGADTRVRDT